MLSFGLGEQLWKLVSDHEAAQDLVQLGGLLAENELFHRQFRRTHEHPASLSALEKLSLAAQLARSLF